MKKIFAYILYPLLIMAFVGCQTNNKNQSKTDSKITVDTVVADTLSNSNDLISLKDSVVLKETYNEEDVIANEYLTETLKPIRKNFKRINSITKWGSVIKKDLWETNEGGETSFFYSNGVLEKIVTRHFGETFQKLSEYYLFNGQLSYVLEKSYKYNRPIYYDSAKMTANNDNEAFNYERSEIIEDRSYFEKGKLIHQLNNQDCGSPFADDYLLEEQLRIKSQFDRIIKLTNIK